MDEEHMLKFREKWGMHVFNKQHPAYTNVLWEELIRCVRRLMKNITEPLDGFDKAIVKRQIYHMMFLEQEPDNPFETIAYNDTEYLNEYDGLAGLMTRFDNSGLATRLNISFKEFIHLPNWLVDWALDWGYKQSLSSSSDTDDALEKLDREMKQAAQNQAKKDPFSKAY